MEGKQGARLWGIARCPTWRKRDKRLVGVTVQHPAITFSKTILWQAKGGIGAHRSHGPGKGTGMHLPDNRWLSTHGQTGQEGAGRTTLAKG